MTHSALDDVLITHASSLSSVNKSPELQKESGMDDKRGGELGMRWSVGLHTPSVTGNKSAHGEAVGTIVMLGVDEHVAEENQNGLNLVMQGNESENEDDTAETSDGIAADVDVHERVVVGDLQMADL